jgi:hypothetical protein
MPDNVRHSAWEEPVTSNLKRGIWSLALTVAAHEIKRWNLKTVMILFPDKSWGLHAPPKSGIPIEVYVRYSNIHTGIGSTTLDLLILADEFDSVWDFEGIRLARNCLLATSDSRMITLTKGPWDAE